MLEKNIKVSTLEDQDARFNHNLKVFVIFGVLFELMNTLFNPYAIKYLQRIGGTDFDISLFNSMKGFIMIFAVLPGVFFVNKFTDAKRITGRFVLISVFFVLLLVIVPFLPAIWQPLVFITLMSLMMIPNAIYNASYQNFTGELFPKRRPQVIAARSMYTIIFTTILTLFSGLIFKYIPKTNEDVIFIYQIFYTLAFFVGLGAFITFRQFNYRPAKNQAPLAFKGSFKTVFSHKPFTQFITASTIFHFGWQMGWPLFSIYMIKNLGADELWLSLINIGSAFAMFYGHRKWPRLIEKYGSARVTTICAAGMAATPILYALSPNLTVLLLISSTSGFFIAGTITVLFTELLDVTPNENRIVYVGYYNTLTNITLAISPFVAHFFLANWGIHIALVATTLFRLIGGLAFYHRERALHPKAE